MHDIKKIRQDPIDFDSQLARRNHPPASNEILMADSERRTKILEFEKAKAKQNIISEQVKKAKIEKDNRQFEILREEISKLKALITKLDLEAK